MSPEALITHIQHLAAEHGYTLTVGARLDLPGLSLDITRTLLEADITLQWGLAPLPPPAPDPPPSTKPS